MTIEVTGSESGAAMDQIQSRSKNLTFSRDEKTGMVSATGKAKTREEKYMMKIINDKKINVQIKAENTNKTSIGISQGGAFSGNEVTIGRNGKVTHVDALQEVNPSALGKLDAETKSLSGNLIWHEISEGYEGGIISAKTGEAACPSILNQANPIYDKAHHKAGGYFPGTIEIYDVTVPDFSAYTKPFSVLNLTPTTKIIEKKRAVR